MRVEIKYLEKPASQTEKEIAHLFETSVQAIAKNDKNLFLQTYADNAKIQFSKQGEKITNYSREEFCRQVFEGRKNIFLLSYSDVRIQTTNPNCASIACFCKTVLRNKPLPINFARHLRIEKKDDAWRISEISFF